MTKKITNSIIIIIIIFLNINLFSYKIYATSIGGGITGGASGGALGEVGPAGIGGKAGATIGGSMQEEFYPEYYKPDSPDNASNADKLLEIGNDIVGFLQIVGSILSVIVLVVLGIKYMVGSAEDRASYKKTMIPYLIGAIMVFAITNFLGIVAGIAKNLI